MATIDDARATLRATFGYESFRPLQEEIVGAILHGEDAFVLMPTGGGKSLCYQLPALLLDGVAIVVSPLIALMKDQVDALQALGVPATFINSSLDYAEIGRRQAALSRGDLRIVYVAPERLMTPGFLRLLSSIDITLFAIDEAHCISEWGHDFRPEYRELTRLRELFPSTTLGAFTATATGRVEADIVAQLRLQGAARFRGSFNRPNLFYDVQPKLNGDRQLISYLQDRHDASGIVYCQARAETERLAGHLQQAGFSAAAYHAGLVSDVRKRRQEAFGRDETRIIVATIAFGMGIDKPDVRFVVHYDLPGSLERYYQESGRAGRDGDPSDCILFYSYADVAKQQYFIEQKPSEAEREVAQRQLRQMASWADSAFCRRRALLSYFDEPLDASPAPCCDVCQNPPEMADCTIQVQMLLSCALRTGERFGNAYLIEVLRGSTDERIRRFGHDRLTTFGVGRDRSKEHWQHIARHLLLAGYTRQEAAEFNAIKVTERGRAVLFKGETVSLPVPPVRGRAPRLATAAAQALANPALFEQLRTVRKRLADERAVPPYVIFHDSVLRGIAASLPRTPEDLLRIPGVGERKVQDYGDAVLACIAGFGVPSSELQVPGPQAKRPSEIETRPSKLALSPTAHRTLDLFREGRSPDEIGTTRGLAPSTIEGHLADAIECGELALDGLVDRERQRAIEQAIDEVGPDLLTPIRERLGEDYGYGEIRFVRAAYTRRREVAS